MGAGLDPMSMGRAGRLVSWLTSPQPHWGPGGVLTSSILPGSVASWLPWRPAWPLGPRLILFGAFHPGRPTPRLVEVPPLCPARLAALPGGAEATNPAPLSPALSPRPSPPPHPGPPVAGREPLPSGQLLSTKGQGPLLVPLQPRGLLSGSPLLSCSGNRPSCPPRPAGVLTGRPPSPQAAGHPLPPQCQLLLGRDPAPRGWLPGGDGGCMRVGARTQRGRLSPKGAQRSGGTWGPGPAGLTSHQRFALCCLPLGPRSFLRDQSPQETDRGPAIPGFRWAGSPRRLPAQLLLACSQ